MRSTAITGTRAVRLGDSGRAGVAGVDGRAVVYALAVWWAAVRLPVDDVPLHFGASGLADAFGTRAEALAGHIGFGMLMVGLGVASIVLARRGPLRLVNMPYKDYWTAPE